MLRNTSTSPARAPSMYTQTMLGSTKLSGPRARSQLEWSAATASYTVAYEPSTICSRVITERSMRRVVRDEAERHAGANAITARETNQTPRLQDGRRASNERIGHLAGGVYGAD